MLSETGLRLFEAHMEVTEAENLHWTAHWALLRYGEESRTSSVRSIQCKVRYRVYVHDIVCVLHCYLRKRPGPVPRFSLSKLSRYCAALACCVLCAYCTSVSAQAAGQAGALPVGPPLVARSEQKFACLQPKSPLCYIPWGSGYDLPGPNLPIYM